MMLDLNNEKITHEEKEDILLQQVDKRYREKRLRFGGKPFQRYWILTYDCLKLLNNNAIENEAFFHFQPDDLEGYDDLFSNCVLYEADRIREGEWDRFYNRWSSRNYIRCFVVLSRTPIYGVEEQGLVSGRLVINKGKTPSTDERIKRFPNTWNSDGTMRYGEEWIQGAIEFDPSLLKTVELLCDEENIERAKKTGKKGEIKEGNGKGLGCFERTMWWKRSDFDKYVDRKLRRRGTRRNNKKGFS